MSARLAAAIALVGAALILALVLVRRRQTSSPAVASAPVATGTGPSPMSAEDLGRALELALGASAAKPPRQGYYDPSGAIVASTPGYVAAQGYPAATASPTVSAPASPVARATPSMVVSPVAATTNQTVAPVASVPPGVDRGWDWGSYGNTLGKGLIRGYSVDQRGNNVRAKGYPGSTYQKDPWGTPPTASEWNELFAERRRLGLQTSGF